MPLDISENDRILFSLSVGSSSASTVLAARLPLNLLTNSGTSGRLLSGGGCCTNCWGGVIIVAPVVVVVYMVGIDDKYGLFREPLRFGNIGEGSSLISCQI